MHRFQHPQRADIQIPRKKIILSRFVVLSQTIQNTGIGNRTALETEQHAKAATIYQQRKTDFDRADFSNSRWLTVLPDVFTRVAEISK